MAQKRKPGKFGKIEMPLYFIISNTGQFLMQTTGTESGTDTLARYLLRLKPAKETIENQAPGIRASCHIIYVFAALKTVNRIRRKQGKLPLPKLETKV